jgi:hypothetical protein
MERKFDVYRLYINKKQAKLGGGGRVLGFLDFAFQRKNKDFLSGDVYGPKYIPWHFLL